MFATSDILKTLGLLNKYLGLALVYSGQMTITGVLIMKGYFDGIPLDIEETAKVDGASRRQLLVKIIFPLARPGVIVTAVMILIYVWNEYVYSVLFMNNADRYTLAAGLYSLQATEYTRNWPLFSAASILVSMPVLVLFYTIQKRMASGLISGGVKG